MANEDKIAKTIDDATLDEVSGGNLNETAKDIAFLKALGLNATNHFQVVEAWAQLGIENTYYGNKNKNIYAINDENANRKVAISRNDAMILTMRKQKKYLDLEKYI